MPKRQNPNRESYSELKRRQLDDVDATVEFEEEKPIGNSGTTVVHHKDGSTDYNVVEDVSAEQDYFDRLHAANAHGLQLLKVFTNARKAMDKNTYERELFGGILADAELKLRAKLLDMLTEEHQQIEAFAGEENG